MRHFVDRYRFVLALCSAAILTGACGKLTPNGGNETMTLLRDGSQKVCVASDVQKTLRDIIVPKAATLDANVPIENRIKAVAALSVSLDMTTLTSFDASVSRAMCNATVRIGSANVERKSDFTVDYAVTPSAEDASTFVISANIADAHSFAVDLAGDEIDDIVAKNYVEQQTRENEQRQQQLLATVNEKWLAGAWIDANSAAENCGNGQAVWFEKGHVLEGVMGTGRWALAKDRLHLTTGGFDKTGTIDAADAISFHVSWGDESSFSLRRCTRAEVEALPQASDAEIVQ